MIRKEFTQMLLDNHISSVAIIRVPDYSGGHKFNVLLNMSEDEVDEWLQDQDFTYLEWFGDASEVATHHNDVFYSHVERLYEEPLDEPYTMEELIMETLS